MRVFSRKGICYLQWWDSETQRNVRKSLGFELEGDWKKSKHAREIREAIQTIERERMARDLSIIPQQRTNKVLDLPELLSAYNEANRERRGRKSPATLRHRETAVRFFLKHHRHATSRDITRTNLLRVRRLAEDAGISPASVKGYFRELATLAKYGYELGCSPEEYPARGIKIELPSVEPIPTPKNQERKFFTYLFTYKRPLFDQLWFLRLTGARASVSCNLTWDLIDLDRRTWIHHNTKARRKALMPMQTALYELFSNLGQKVGHVFSYRNPTTLYHYAQNACNELGQPNINPHQLKANYLYDLDGLDISDRLLTLAAHHSPQGESSVVSRHYSRNRSALLGALEEAQSEQVEFFRNLRQPPENK